MTTIEARDAAAARIALRINRELHADELSSLHVRKDSSGTWQVSVVLRFVLTEHVDTSIW